MVQNHTSALASTTKLAGPITLISGAH
jgi:hypothetical protein